MPKEFSLTIEQDEEGRLVAVVPELEGYRIEAESVEELVTKLKEVLNLYLELQEGQ